MTRNRRETPPGAPHPPISSGLTTSSHQLTVGGSNSPVKPRSELAHQPGQPRTYPATDTKCGGRRRHRAYSTRPPHARPCGGVQHREIKSAGQTDGAGIPMVSAPGVGEFEVTSVNRLRGRPKVSQDGATHLPLQSTEGRSDPPVKPTSEVAHQPGQQPAARE